MIRDIIEYMFVIIVIIVICGASIIYGNKKFENKIGDYDKIERQYNDNHIK